MGLRQLILTLTPPMRLPHDQPDQKPFRRLRLNSAQQCAQPAYSGKEPG